MNQWWGCNYGANLTAYALQKAIKDAGYDNKLLYYCGGEDIRHLYENTVFQKFANTHLDTTDHIVTESQLYNLNNEFTTFIVGSDQVWRHLYTKFAQYSYFFDFVHPGKKIISMAASLGTHKLDYPVAMQEKLACLLRRFDAVSLREKDALKDFKDKLDIDAQWVIDPVFLYDAAWWSRLADSSEESLPDRYVATYVLDDSDELKMKMKSEFSELPCEDITKCSDGSPRSVAGWVRLIRDCECLFTDSFHGMCYAIIFRKPFLVLGNKARGFSRFSSMLEPLGLSHRVVEHIDELSRDTLYAPLDDSQLATKLNPLIDAAARYLNDALSSPCKNNRMDYASLLAIENRQAIRELNSRYLRLFILKYTLLSRLSWGARKRSYLATIERMKKLLF